MRFGNFVAVDFSTKRLKVCLKARMTIFLIRNITMFLQGLVYSPLIVHHCMERQEDRIIGGIVSILHSIGIADALIDTGRYISTSFWNKPQLIVDHVMRIFNKFLKALIFSFLQGSKGKVHQD